MPIVAVVIPTLNESGTIGTLVEGLLAHREHFQMEIIVMDDGSTDGTMESIQTLNKRHGGITLIERGKKLGFGTAIRDGLSYALNSQPFQDCVVTMDADLSHDPEDLPSLVRACSQDTLVIGSRYVQGEKRHGWSPYTKVISWGAKLLARAFTDVSARDCT
ncbi:MAG TPA: glycosyltransferase [Patescibacteria group bacterium]|nr:glycosyltransferase [Patescibacteria group bacterium]